MRNLTPIRPAWTAGLLLLLALLGGCAHTGAYNAAYLAAARRPAVVADGRVRIVTAPTDDQYVYSGKPTSFTGSANTLTLPVGSILRESAVAAFADTFKGGAIAAAAGAPADGPALAVSPVLQSFSYEYNQLKNIGFAITPTAVIKVQVRVLDAKGQPVWSRDYDSGAVEGPSYMISTAPAEEIVKVAHKAAYDVMLKAAGDIAREVAGAPVAPAVSPPG